MGRPFKNSGEILADRALSADEPEEQRGRVYSGNMSNADSGMSGGDDAPKPRRRTPKRRLSVLNVLVVLAAGSTIVLLYIYNTVRVGELLGEIGGLETEAQKLKSTNEVLQAEINRKSKLERIGTLATTELGMISPRQQPVWFSLDSTAAQNAAAIRDTSRTGGAGE